MNDYNYNIASRILSEHICCLFVPRHQMHASSKIILQQIVSNIHYTIKLNSISDKCFSKLMKSNSLLQQTLSVFLFVSVLK